MNFFMNFNFNEKLNKFLYEIFYIKIYERYYFIKKCEFRIYGCILFSPYCLTLVKFYIFFCNNVYLSHTFYFIEIFQCVPILSLKTRAVYLAMPVSVYYSFRKYITLP